MKFSLSVTAVLSSLALGPLSHSAEPAANDEDTKKGNRAVQFGKLDKNADGTLSKDEFLHAGQNGGGQATGE